MFKFDFQQNEEDLNDFEGIGDYDSTGDTNSHHEFTPCNDFEEIHAKSSQINSPIISSVIYGRMTFGNDNEIRYVRMDTQDDFLLDIKGDHADLIPGVYEGGGKIWESTQDLGDYLMKSTDQLCNKHILDLGCGAGILGILALKAGASVHFSDYNSSILSTLTIDNVLLNFQQNKSEILQRCKFYAGDWSKYVEATRNDTKYDIILTSEAIYNPENNWKILDVFKSKLKKDGVALVAAKTYYFGVGGGCRDFEKLIKADGIMQSEVVLVVSENVQREILKVTFINKSDI